MKLLMLFLVVFLTGCDLLSSTSSSAWLALEEYTKSSNSPVPYLTLKATECAVSIPPSMLGTAPVELLNKITSGEIVTPACTAFFEVADVTKQEHVLPLVAAIVECRQ